MRVMLDIRVIRENPEEVKARLKPRSGDAWKLVDDVLACDEARRNAETEKQALQSERNATSKQIGMLKKKGEDTSSIEARVREIGDRIRELDRVAEENAAQLTSLLMNIPNLPHLECPVGADETANPEIKLWGEKPAIENPKDHVELAANLGMISFEDGARITGSGFVVYRGAGARLERALINFLLNTQTVENGYQEVGVPFVVKRECMEGTGQLPKFEEDMYGTEDQQMFLIPTAEVPVTNLYRDTILQESDLPIKMAAYTPCFRREAGSAGRINRGMIRVHQYTVTILTMGPGRAAEVIREGLYRGADNGYLLTDRAFAGADTLATSYALATAIKKIGDYDVIIGGRQAIDGDTAQVGPQVAEKLGLTQVTYAEEILNVDKAAKKITVKRHIDGGVETVEAPLPIVITVNGSAAPCRPRNAKLVQKYKRALGAQEKDAITKEGAELAYAGLYEKYPYLNITEWSVADVNGDLAQCGLSGSPTKVKTIQNISFQAKESKTLTGSDKDVEDLIVELLANHTIG